jgi:branched-chain amino acid transport system permease protein
MAIATGIYHTNYRQDLALRQTRSDWVRLGLLVIALVVAPFVASPYWLTILNLVGIAAIGAIGLNILTGFTGLISLGQGAFLAVGAYTSGILVARFHWPTPLGIIAAVFLTAAVGAVVGLPAVRLKGLYLAIATLAAQVIIIHLVRTWEVVTGGVDSLVVPRPVVFGTTIRSDFIWYWIILAFAVLTTLAALNLFRTGLGRAFVAIRDQDIAADVIGVAVWKYKLWSFAISSGFVGLAGALLAHYRSIVTWERFTFEVSIIYVAMIIVGADPTSRPGDSRRAAGADPAASRRPARGLRPRHHSVPDLRAEGARPDLGTQP